mmetsp:Transcript_18398/g.25313  ORF Transcript_18398/g.25313 Transcript_18398/m.25313 type:complete len:134 (-) Transcript_18398:174-575(-)|eukprot:CAMPEP_0185723676 /NCGR_PEP_ID=MMETSP1171-20130828/437_1 /TAXON_ID=374046 /ORGANISM="Helicotheca tamensis, Strain CCMP826" /LENGTH=133 /DNA_ID=CAMNT_0028391415 /DNA_START=65 /DNA_END=466 /DNA_ORIENTATION=-
MSIPPANLPPIQDMPPSGGYAKIDTVRSLPARGPKGWQLWAGTSLAIMYGFYQVGQYNKASNQQKLEERKVRYAIAPILQAEADREYLERELVNIRKEAEIMKHIPGWVAGRSPYHSVKWMPRRIAPFDRNCK